MSNMYVFFYHLTNRFAARARSVKNKPQLNEVMSDGVLLKRYAKQIDKLQAELEVSIIYCKYANFFYCGMIEKTADFLSQVLDLNCFLCWKKLLRVKM